MASTAQARPMVLAMGLKFALLSIDRVRFDSTSTGIAEYAAAIDKVQYVIEQLKAMAQDTNTPSL
jgi:hypothetical protein